MTSESKTLSASWKLTFRVFHLAVWAATAWSFANIARADLAPNPADLLHPKTFQKPTPSITMSNADVEVQISSSPGHKVGADVTCKFDMWCATTRRHSELNLKPGQPVLVDVRFPLSYVDEMGPTTTSFSVTVDGKPVSDVRRDKWQVKEHSGKLRTQLGYTWRVAFHAQEESRIDVRYQLELPAQNRKVPFTYFLTSGSGWDGPIGRETVHVSADNGLKMEVASPIGLKPSAMSDSAITWELKNAWPDEDIRLNILPASR